MGEAGLRERSLGVTLAVAVFAALVGAGCAGPSASRAESSSARAGASTTRTGTSAPGGEAASFTSEPWTYNDRPGEILSTPHYRLFITDTRPTTRSRLPEFLETALGHYRTALTAPESPLPAPGLQMETFVLDTRSDWELLTRHLLGDRAAPFLRIQRGGFAYAGRALLFDIGTHDTLAVAAHEGWHQYTQRTFRNPLPIWLEEGLAAYMEGHRWGGARGGQVMFLPWANVERFDMLRRAHAAKKTVSLNELLTSSPRDLISATESEPGLTYYAQVWALAHFLAEGAGGRYRGALQGLLHDAAAGRVPQTVANILGPQGGRAGPLGGLPRPLSLNSGPVLFLAYFNQNLPEAEREYAEFIGRLVQPGSRGAIVDGRSPIAAESSGAPAAGVR